MSKQQSITRISPKRLAKIVEEVYGPIDPTIQVGDIFVVEREIDKKLNYNICIYTGEYNFDKLVYEELDPHKIAEARGEAWDKEKPEDGQGDEHLYEEFRWYLVDRFNFRREQIMVCEIINKNNDKKLIDYLEKAKTTQMNYCEYVGQLKNLPMSWEALNEGFLSENNEYEVTLLVKEINNHFRKLNRALTSQG